MIGRFLPGFLSFSSLLFAGNAVLQPRLPDSGAQECAAKAEGFVNGRLAFWQQRLKLQDWTVSIVMSQASDLRPKTLGNVHWDTSKQTAVIRVLRASEYQLACRAMLDDMELTVVHELVHLELSSLPRSTASRSEEEHAVIRITDALLALDRNR